MKTFVFQGDSITDACRSRENDNYAGVGYPTLTAGRIGLDNPGEYNFCNRGISGDRIVDLYARIKKDCINLKPDYLSVLIGINDVWHEVSRQNGVDAPKFEKIYNMYIEECLEALPELKIFILEPFVLKGSATEGAWDTFRSETLLRAEAAKRVAEKHGLPFIPLQEDMDKLNGLIPTSLILMDGVHPTSVGHELIARKLTEAFYASLS